MGNAAAYSWLFNGRAVAANDTYKISFTATYPALPADYADGALRIFIQQASGTYPIVTNYISAGPLVAAGGTVTVNGELITTAAIANLSQTQLVFGLENERMEDSIPLTVTGFIFERVTDPIPLTGITLPATEEVYTERTLQLTAVRVPAGATDWSEYTVTWSSDAEGVATVSNTGLVSGVSVGTAKIKVTATKASGTPIVSNECTVTVNALPAALTSVSIVTGTGGVAFTTASPVGGTGFTASGTLAEVITAIRDAAFGGDITITFGDGITALSTGAGATFDGTGWGAITLKGKLTSTQVNAITIGGANTVNIVDSATEIKSNGTSTTNGTVLISGADAIVTIKDSLIENEATSGTNVVAVFRNGAGDVTIDGARIKAGGTSNTTRTVWLANASGTGGKVILKGKPEISSGNTATGVLGIYIAFGNANSYVVLDSSFELADGQTYRLARSGGETTAGLLRVQGGAKYASAFTFGGSGALVDLSIRGEDLVNTIVSSIAITGTIPTAPFDIDEVLKLDDLDDMVVTAAYAAPADSTAAVNHNYLAFSPALPYTFTSADTASTTKEFTVTFGTRTTTFTVNLKQPENQGVTITIDFGLSDPDDIAIEPFTLKWGGAEALRTKTLAVEGNFTVEWFIDGVSVSTEKTLVLDADDFNETGTYTLRVEAKTTSGIKPVIYSKTITFTVTL
jgi:hypothetical protein